MLNLEESEAQIDIADLLNIEIIASGQLPALFKKIYLKNNGGFPQATRVQGDYSEYAINGFNPIKYGLLPIEKLMMEFHKDHQNLRSQVPFAYDDGGNTFMLSLNKADSGAVYLWLQDEERLEKVCASFDGFIAAMQSD